MSGLFGGGKKPAPPVDNSQEQKVSAQEDKVERQEVGEQRKIMARRRSKRVSGRSQLMSPGVNLGDDTPGRQVMRRVLGTGRNPR